MIDVADLRTIPNEIESIILEDFSKLPEEIVNNIKNNNIICYKNDVLLKIIMVLFHICQRSFIKD